MFTCNLFVVTLEVLCRGDCTQKGKNETTVTLAEAKNYFSDFFTDVEY